MNIVLSAMLTLIACAAAFIWCHPEAAEVLAVTLRARAAGLRAARAAYLAAFREIHREARGQ